MASIDISWYQESLADAYKAIDGDSNDAEHDALLALVEIVEAALTAAGAELPPRPDS
jgi:hypothetical protein